PALNEKQGCRLGKLECSLGIQGSFPRVVMLGHGVAVLLKELLSLLAAGSPRAVIEPVDDLAGHDDSFHQYFGTLGSIWSAQARMPPLRFLIFVKPCCRRNCTALALRAPILQWTTISLFLSSSPQRCGNSGSGINVLPGILQRAYSGGL